MLDFFSIMFAKPTQPNFLLQDKTKQDKTIQYKGKSQEKTTHAG